MSKISKPFVLFLMGAALSSLNCGPKESPPFSRQAAGVHLEVPDFNLPLYGKASVSMRLSDLLARQGVLLIFWATWCPSCQEETVLLNEWQRRQFPAGVKILAVNVRQTEKEIQGFEQQHPLRYTVLLDSDAQTASRYQVEELPTVILLAKGGKILYYGFRVPKDIQTYLAEGERSDGFSRPGF